MSETQVFTAKASGPTTIGGDPTVNRIGCGAMHITGPGMLGSIDIAQKKAWTARAFDITTKDLGANSQSGDQFFGIHASNNGKVMIFAGGIPLKKGGKIVGAIGISGGSGEQDHAVAEAWRLGPLNRPMVQ